MTPKPPPGVMDNPLHPLSRGCISHLLFNEGAGSLANDASGHMNHGHLINMASKAQFFGWSGCKYGSGLGFTSTNGYVDCGNDLVSGMDELSIIAIVNVREVVEDGTIFNAMDDGSGTNSAILFYAKNVTPEELAELEKLSLK